MLDVLRGFTTIWVVIGVGVLVAHLGLFGRDAQRMLSRFAFFIGLPPLMAVTMYRADLERIFSVNVLVSIGAILVSSGLYLGSCLLRARLAGRARPGPSHLIIGTFCSAYVNANNMGAPIAAYVMKDLDFDDDSITDSKPLLRGSTQTVTVEDGEWLELFGTIATPAE